MILSASDLALMRNRPHGTKLWLSIYRPSTILSARVNDISIVRGATAITYDGFSGDYTQVQPNMTLLVGSAAGASDKGKVRIKSITSTIITVAENSDVSWADNLYLTIINFVDIWPVYPKIVQDPADAENVLFYKDGDIAHTNQNEVMGSFACAGPNRAAFLENGTVDLFYSSSGTYNVNGEALTYLWSFEGGTPTGSTAAHPGNVAYTTPGHYRTTLLVTNASGGVDRTHRFVSIYDRPGKGSNTPILQWEMTQMDGSRAAGGYTLGLKVWSQLSDIQDGALVVIWADDTYGTTEKSIGGNSENNSKIVFSGYILKGSIQFNYRESFAEFDVGSISEVMKLAEGFAISCESVLSPTTWYQIKNLTVPKSIYHYLRWHSTVLNVADFQYTGDNRSHQYLDTDRQSLYDAIDNFLRTGIVGKLVTDRQGKLWAEIEAEGVHLAKSTLPTTMFVDKNDWVGDPVIQDNPLGSLSYLEMGGAAYSGPYTGTYAAFMTDVPGVSPSYRGRSDTQEGLILLGQEQLNDLGGDVFAYKNSRYLLNVMMAGNYRNLDIAPIEQVRMNIGANDTIRGIRLDQEPFHITDISWTYDAERGLFYPYVTYHQVTEGVAGSTVIIPEAPPDEGSYQPPATLPPIIWPGIGAHPSYTIALKNPVVDTDGIPLMYFAYFRTITRVDAVCKNGTSLKFNLEYRTDPAVTGTKIWSSDQTVTTSETPILTFTNKLIPPGTRLWLTISEVTGSISKVAITITT